MSQIPLHGTPHLDAAAAPLPAGVTRCPQCTQDTTLANCWAVSVTLRTWGGGEEFSLVCWRDRRPPIRPVNKDRITALRPGDLARWKGKLCEVVGLQVWR